VVAADVKALQEQLQTVLRHLDKIQDDSQDRSVIISNYDHTIRRYLNKAESVITSSSRARGLGTPSMQVSSLGASHGITNVHPANDECFIWLT
jgi:hypothetical protein